MLWVIQTPGFAFRLGLGKSELPSRINRRSNAICQVDSNHQGWCDLTAGFNSKCRIEKTWGTVVTV